MLVRYLPLPVLLVLLTESELEDGLRECDRGPRPGDMGALLGEWAALGVCPVLLWGDGCRDCEECEDRLRRWWYVRSARRPRSSRYGSRRAELEMVKGSRIRGSKCDSGVSKPPLIVLAAGLELTPEANMVRSR